MTCDLTSIDRYFADFICRQAGVQSTPLLKLAASLASSAVGRGHICLHLADLAGKRFLVDGREQALPGLDEIRRELEATPVVGAPGEFRPLIIDAAGRLYLYRYWKYERDLAGVIVSKAAAQCRVNERLLGEGLARLFPSGGGEELDWQKVAAAAAVRKQFCVISGGPGTGKTSTVVKIIALLAEQAQGEPLRIALAAPTGKAATRLKESIRSMKEKLDCSADVRAEIPDEVSTLHRLLGARGSSIRFRHAAENLLPWDVVIVDEASMVALPLMAKLAVSLRPDARLILLGDRDQLASVEAGAVLGDICGRGRREQFSPEFADFMVRVAGEQLPSALIGDACSTPSPEPRVPSPVFHAPVPGPRSPLIDSLVILRKNYRFGADSGIGRVAGAVNAGEGGEALALLKDDTCLRTSWQNVPSVVGVKRALAERVVVGYEAYLRAQSPEEALKKFDSFRVLCALRQGPYGVSGVTALIEEILAANGLINRRSRWYHGRPVMITVNDYNLKLFNGDVGIILTDEGDGSPKVYFPGSEGGVRAISPVRLPDHETVFAMTVHKSQGSEFDRVLLLLTPQDSVVLARELIYTGLTRARHEVELWGDETVFLNAVRRMTDRDSGLEDSLWPGSSGG
jgi:exodeoxyribonuclease V alpha subunit